MKIPRPISNLIDAFERLPGIGPKTAQRLTFYLLHFPLEELERFGDALIQLKKGTKICSICKNVDEQDPCGICSDARRQTDSIIVVATPIDVLAFEKIGYKGKYHVLHGVINPLSNIGPDELYINDLIKRLKSIKTGANADDTLPSSTFSDFGGDGGMRLEVVLATNTGMEGEATAMYIAKLIRDNGFSEDEVRITRIARGLPVGGDIEYADDVTLTLALEGRLAF